MDILWGVGAAIFGHTGKHGNKGPGSAGPGYPQLVNNKTNFQKNDN